MKSSNIFNTKSKKQTFILSLWKKLTIEEKNSDGISFNPQSLRYLLINHSTDKFTWNGWQQLSIRLKNIFEDLPSIQEEKLKTIDKQILAINNEITAYIIYLLFLINQLETSSATQSRRKKDLHNIKNHIKQVNEQINNYQKNNPSINTVEKSSEKNNKKIDADSSLQMITDSKVKVKLKEDLDKSNMSQQTITSLQTQQLSFNFVEELKKILNNKETESLLTYHTGLKEMKKILNTGSVNTQISVNLKKEATAAKTGFRNFYSKKSFFWFTNKRNNVVDELYEFMQIMPENLYNTLGKIVIDTLINLIKNESNISTDSLKNK